jgi:hypothetical protein
VPAGRRQALFLFLLAVTHHELDTRPGTRRTVRGAAIQTAAAEMAQHAIARRKASL